MKKGKLVIVAGLVLFLGLLFYLSKADFLSRISKNKTEKTVISQAATQHQGHTTGEAQPETPQEKVGEVPTVEIPHEKQQLIGVKTVEVTLRPLQKIIRTVGRIEYDETRLATVNTKIEGWIEKLYVNYSGISIKKGDPLAEIYSPELIATQQELLNITKWVREGKEIKDNNLSRMLSRDADRILEATKQRLKLWDISDEQIKNIVETGAPMRTLTIYSPVSGYVIQKMAVQGMRIMPGEKLFDIADLSTIWVISDIYEYELPLIKIGQNALVTLSYLPDKSFSSRIDFIYPTLAGETRTAKVRFTIPNTGGKLKPQMFTNVEVKIDIGKRLSIPDDAVIDTGKRQIVYVDRSEGYFEPREVMLGIRAEGWREVLMGLKAGERVAASATFLIDSEAQLKGVTPLDRHEH